MALSEKAKENKRLYNIAWREKNKEHRKAYRKNYYEKNREQILAEHIKNRDKYNAYGRKYTENFNIRVHNYFGAKCAICAVSTLDFEIYECHHLDPSLKEAIISELKAKPWQTEVVPELEKCVYLCRNCHARLHKGRFNNDIISGRLVLIPGKIIKEAA